MNDEKQKKHSETPDETEFQEKSKKEKGKLSRGEVLRERIINTLFLTAVVLLVVVGVSFALQWFTAKAEQLQNTSLEDIEILETDYNWLDYGQMAQFGSAGYDDRLTTEGFGRGVTFITETAEELKDLTETATIDAVTGEMTLLIPPNERESFIYHIRSFNFILGVRIIDPDTLVVNQTHMANIDQLVRNRLGAFGRGLESLVTDFQSLEYLYSSDELLLFQEYSDLLSQLQGETNQIAMILMTDMSPEARQPHIDESIEIIRTEIQPRLAEITEELNLTESNLRQRAELQGADLLSPLSAETDAFILRFVKQLAALKSLFSGLIALSSLGIFLIKAKRRVERQDTEESQAKMQKRKKISAAVRPILTGKVGTQLSKLEDSEQPAMMQAMIERLKDDQELEVPKLEEEAKNTQEYPKLASFLPPTPGTD